METAAAADEAPQGVLALGIKSGGGELDVTALLQARRASVEHTLATHLRCEQINIESIEASEFGRVTAGNSELSAASELFIVSFRAQGPPLLLRGSSDIDIGALAHDIQRSLTSSTELVIVDVSVEWTQDTNDDQLGDGEFDSRVDELGGSKYVRMGAILLGSSASVLLAVSGANFFARRFNSSSTVVVDAVKDSSRIVEPDATLAEDVGDARMLVESGTPSQCSNVLAVRDGGISSRDDKVDSDTLSAGALEAYTGHVGIVDIETLLDGALEDSIALSSSELPVLNSQFCTSEARDAFLATSRPSSTPDLTTAISSSVWKVEVGEDLVDTFEEQPSSQIGCLDQSDVTTEVSDGQAGICRFARLVAAESGTLLSL